MNAGHVRRRPLVRASFFVIGEEAYAWMGWNVQSSDWECVRVQCAGEPGTQRWAEAAFTACIAAFRALQARHRDKDLVVGLELPPGIPGGVTLNAANWPHHH
jgi:hypothetical protein